MTSPFWTDQPPPASTYIPIFAARGPGGRAEGVILSEKSVGIFVHFSDNRTIPCTGELSASGAVNVASCRLCLDGMPRRWRGYIGVQDVRSGKIGLMELTSFAVQNCRVLCTSATTLRGKRIKLSRAGQRRNGHVNATIEEWANSDSPDLPPAPDVVGALMRIWYGGGIHDEKDLSQMSVKPMKRQDSTARE